MSENEILNIINEEETNLKDIYKKIDYQEYINSKKIIDAFKKENLSESDFSSTTGYGYGDIGRDKIEKIYADIFESEDALVRSQFISGTHALTTALFALLRPNDIMLSITGLPYDTLHEVIGIRDNRSSLKSYGISFEYIDLKDNDFDYEEIKKRIVSKKYKLIEIQRSKGYSLRKSIDTKKLKEVIEFIKNIDKDIIIMVDDCYCEFVENDSPISLGADIAVGSLIKNLGGGIAPCGGYIVGKKEYITLCSERLNVPGEAKEVGPSLGNNKSILMGLYNSPFVVASSLKVAVLSAKVLERLGYDVEPKYNDLRADIVQTIIFNNREDVINYINGIQAYSAVDNNVNIVPTQMPGYDCDIVMASGSFVQGSSIEISCDAPLREPYVVYQQGSISYNYGKLALISAITKLLNK